MKKLNILLISTLVLLVALTSCAHSIPADQSVVQFQQANEPHGFWWGLWNGWTAVFSSIGRLFDKDIAIYDSNNNGGWYDLGFFMGISGVAGGIWNGIFGSDDSKESKERW